MAERGKVGVMAVESNTNVLLFSVKLWNNKFRNVIHLVFAQFETYFEVICNSKNKTSFVASSFCQHEHYHCCFKVTNDKLKYYIKLLISYILDYNYKLTPFLFTL